MKSFMKWSRITSMLKMQDGEALFTQEIERGIAGPVDGADASQEMRVGCGNRISIKGTYTIEWHVPGSPTLGNDNVIEIDPEIKIVVVAQDAKVQMTEDAATETPSE